MSFLFVVENGIAKPNTETLLIEPFSTIWSRDKSPDKETATKEFTFMEFMMSKKKTNPYAGYDDKLRHDRLMETMPDKWKEDGLVKRGMIKIKDFQTEASETYQYYLAVKAGAEKMRDFFNNFDINERNEKNGSPVYKPAEITRALNDTDKVLQNIHTMKEKVEQELFEQTKTRGNKTINIFEE